IRLTRPKLPLCREISRRKEIHSKELARTMSCKTWMFSWLPENLGISWRKLLPRRAAPRQDWREIKFLRNGCPGRIRTYGWWIQSPLPYRLATGQQQFAEIILKFSR